MFSKILLYFVKILFNIITNTAVIQMTGLLKKIKGFLLPRSDTDIRAEASRINFRSMLMVSLIAGFIEATGLVLLLITTYKGENTPRSIKSLAFGFLFCLVFHINLHIIKRKYITNYKVMGVETLLFFGVMAIWGMGVSYNHYIRNDQMLTFYAVIICLICTVILRPLYSIIFVAVPFGTLFALMYRFDGASHLNVFNYSTLMLLCIIGSIYKYKITVEVLHSRAEVTKLNKKLRLAARTDIITDIQNRYALTGDITNHTGSNVLLCVCDVDRFKHFNDKYGHATGDEIIKAIAGILTDEFGTGDVYRYGGDEFVITGREGPEAFEEKIAKVKSALKALVIDGVDETITCSFGTAQSTVFSREDFDNLFREADSKMYAEKNAARSQT